MHHVRLVYLDQQHWVALLKAREPPGTEVLERLRAAVDANEVAVPLVCGHYLETWNRAQWGSRSALAAVMRDLSQWRTLAPTQAVARLEIERALQRGPPVTPKEVLGTGANHAFESPTGRFRMVERAWTRERPKEGALIPGVPGYFEEIQDKHPEAWEWLNLAGPDVDFPLPGFDDSQFEIRPEHRRGDEFVAHERELVARLAADGMSDRLRDALVMLDLDELLDDINEACLGLKFNPDALRRQGAVRALHGLLPSRDVFVDLRWLRLQDPGFPLEQHDRTDLISLAVALVYCDVVVTERRWAHFARRAGVSRRYGTTVVSKLAELLRILAPEDD